MMLASRAFLYIPLQLSWGVRQRRVRVSTGTMFYIGFRTGPRTDEDGWRYAIGGLELGSDSDSFAADLSTWSLKDYEAQWREGIARFAAGAKSSALITSYAGPAAPFHFMRPMWRTGNQVVFHERLVPGDAIQNSDVAEHFYAAVGERRSRNDDGEPASEWIVPFSDVLAFLASS